MSPSESIQFEGPLYAVKHRTIALPWRPASVVIGKLTPTTLMWQDQGKLQQLHLQDVVGVAIVPAAPTSACFCFVIQAYPRVGQHSFWRRYRRRYRPYTFGCPTATIRTGWLQALRRTLILNDLPPSASSSRHLQILLNPSSGKGNARHIFAAVRPVLEQSGLTLTVTETHSHAQAQGLLQDMDLTAVDGLVMVGGDGTVYGVINSLMQRSDWQQAIQTPIGVIPAGTGNGLCKTILAQSGEPYDPISAALVIAKGQQHPLDLLQVEQQGRCSYSVLSVAWAFIGDVDVGSDHLRYLGSWKNELYSAQQVWRFPAYKGRLSYLPHGAPPTQGPFPPLNQPLPSTQPWQSLTDEFVVFWAMNVTWAAHNLKSAPHAALADGALDMWMIRRGIARWQLILALLRIARGTHIRLPYVDYQKVQCLRLEPLTPLGTLAVDGEQMAYTPLQVAVLPSLGRVFCGPL